MPLKTWMRFCIPVLVCFLTVSCSRPDSGDHTNQISELNGAGFSKEGLAKIEQLMDRAVDEKRVPSAISMLAYNGSMIWLRAAGEMGPGVEMSDEAIVPLASVGKMYTATAAMILVERDQIALDDPVSKYIPEFANVKIEVQDGGGGAQLVSPDSPITLRHLLTHTSGLTVSGDAFWEVWNANADKTSTTQMARDLAALPLQYQPGKGFDYGPTGAAYEVLGAVIELASGMTLEDYMIENIFEPLGLEDTYFYIPDEKAHRLPAFYSKRNGPLELSRQYAKEFPRSDYYFGGGGVSASPKDILHFARLFTDGGSVDGVRILRASTVEEMMTDQLGDLAPESWQAVGRSWGYGAAVTTDGGIAQPMAQEQYGWNGGGYARLWVDRRQSIIAYFAFPLEPPGDNDLLREFERLVYEAIASPQ